MKMYTLIVIASSVLSGIVALPEQGRWTLDLTQHNQSAAVTKTVYKDTKIFIKVDCHNKQPGLNVTIRYTVYKMRCYQMQDGQEAILKARSLTPQESFSEGLANPIVYHHSRVYTHTCEEHIMIESEADQPLTVGAMHAKKAPDNAKTEGPSASEDAKSNAEPAKKDKKVAKRDAGGQNKIEGSKAEPTSDKKATEGKEADPEAAAGKKAGPEITVGKKADTEATAGKKIDTEASAGKKDDTEASAGKKDDTEATAEKKDDPAKTSAKTEVAQYVIDIEGIYVIQVSVTPFGLVEEYGSTVHLDVKTPRGYLSAVDWPLLPFFGVMCAVYVIYGVTWLIVLALQWQDLLRIQFWIGGVILLGMIEKAVLYAEYQSLNQTGVSVQGVMIFAELVSCLKRTLARMLVIIVSFGFGIVKPRLGVMLHRVVGMGSLYFILSAVEGVFRITRSQNDPSKTFLLVEVPLTVLDTAICWWMFVWGSFSHVAGGRETQAFTCNLVQTTRTLRLRRNVVKLTLYRHFTNTLAFACIASVAFMVWALKAHRLTDCITDWKELWVDTAYWHLLFSVILLVIMVLWRPTNNNQRYAFMPLIDAPDEDDEEQMTNDAFDGMKARTMKGPFVNGARDKKEAIKSKTEEDLAWVEENIPASLADAALPNLLDSDEEIMNTKFEMSKME